MKLNLRLWTIIGLFTLFHIITGSTLSLGDDAAYYWQWSNHLALSYFDHPPLIAYLIWLTIHIFGNSPLGVRLSNLLLLPFASLLVYKICNYLYGDENTSLDGVIIFNLLPAFLLGTILVSPDAPLVMCYILALYLFIRIIYEDNAKLWYLLGVVVGFGLLSKYIMILFFFNALLYLSLNKSSRHWLICKEPYLAGLIAFVIFLPVIIWNYQHGFISFKFQFYSRHEHTFHPLFGNFLGFLILQVLVMSPVFGVASTIALTKGFQTKGTSLLTYFSLPVFIIFAIVALFTKVRFNWAVVAYIPLIIMLIGNKFLFTKVKKLGITTTVILCSIVVIQAYYPIFKLKPLKNDPTTDFYSWQPVAAEINTFLSSPDVDSKNWFVFSNRFQSSAQIDYNLYNLYTHYPVYSLANHIEGSSFWQDESQIIGKNGLLVMNNSYQYLPKDKFKCAKINLYKVIDIVRAGTVFRQAFIYQCFNYQGRRGVHL